MTTTKLTKGSHELFMAYAEDSCNWGGSPLVGGNVESSTVNNGHLTDLKKSGLIRTVKDDGDVWVEFTESGIEYAKKNGLTIA